jgi:hypothetical protein
MKNLTKEQLETVQLYAQQAAPDRLEIMGTYTPVMTELKQKFTMIHNKDLMQNTAEYDEGKKLADWIFRLIKDMYHYKGGLDVENPRYKANRMEAFIKKLAYMVQYMRFIGDTELLDTELAKYGMTITMPTLEETKGYDETIQENMKAIFDAAETTQSSICETANTIMIDTYNLLPDELRYDGLTNKTGLKASRFNALVTLEATRQKSERSADKKLESMEQTISDSIEASLLVQAAAQKIAQAE